MEFKKKTIIWEDNNEPPKNYIWVKADGIAYEYDYAEKMWKESTTIIVANTADGPSDEIPTDLHIDPETVDNPIVA